MATKQQHLEWIRARLKTLQLTTHELVETWLLERLAEEREKRDERDPRAARRARVDVLSSIAGKLGLPVPEMLDTDTDAHISLARKIEEQIVMLNEHVGAGSIGRVSVVPNEAREALQRHVEMETARMASLAGYRDNAPLHDVVTGIITRLRQAEKGRDLNFNESQEKDDRIRELEAKVSALDDPFSGADSDAYKRGRSEGHADVCAELRTILDPADFNHWNKDGLLKFVRELNDMRLALFKVYKSPQENDPIAPLFGMKVKLDPTMPKDEIKLRDEQTGEEGYAKISLPEQWRTNARYVLGFRRDPDSVVARPQRYEALPESVGSREFAEMVSAGLAKRGPDIGGSRHVFHLTLRGALAFMQPHEALSKETIEEMLDREAK